MAIIKKSYPPNLHSVFLPVNYTYQTSLSYEPNFRFKYKLNDIDGAFFEGFTVPLEEALSYNNPIEILKTKTEFNFQPEIDTISTVPDNAIMYNQEVSEDISGGDSDEWLVKMGLRYSDPLFIPSDNILSTSEDRDFLVNMPQTHNIRLTDNYTFRTYNGYVNVDDTNDFGAVYSYRMILRFKDGSGNMQSAIIDSYRNPYYGASASDEYDVTRSADNYIIDLPVGVKNWNGKKHKLVGITNSNGDYLNIGSLFGGAIIPNTITLNVSSTGEVTINVPLATYTGVLESYDYYAYRWPGGDAGRISKIHTFNIIQNCRFDAINVAWENTKGGVDYYLFTKANEKIIQTNKDVYKQNLYNLNIDTESVEKNKYNKGMNVYRNNVNTVYEIHSDWLNQEEINGMEDLFHSTEVYMYLNDEWNFVVNAEKKAIIYNKKRKGLKKYVIELLISENKVRY
jgi:hypothetical protein